jgi:WD40 repeat protein
MKNALLFMVVLLLYGSFVSAQAEMSEIARLGRGTGETISWRHDGEIFAVGGSAGIWLFDANYEQIGHYAVFPVQNAEFSPDGNYLAVSDANSMTEIWRLENNGELLERSQPLPLRGYKLRWSPDNRHISSFYAIWHEREFQEMRLDVWNISIGELSWTIPLSDNIVDVIWSPDGQYLAAADRDGHIIIMNSASGETIQTIQIADDIFQESLLEITGIAFQNDGQGLWLIFVGSNKLWAWDLNANELLETEVEMQFVDYGLWGLEGQLGGNFLTTETTGGGGAYGGIYVLSEETEPLSIGFDDFIADYAWVPRANHLAILTGNGMVRERSVLNDTSTEHQLFTGSGDIEWSPDSQWLLQTTGTNPVNFSYPVVAWNITDANLESYQPDRLMYPYLSAKWGRWLPDSQHVMIFSDNTVPHALCLVYAVEQWGIVEDVVTHYWEDGICGLQNAPDLSNLNWDYVADWTQDFGLVAAANRNGIFVSTESPHNDPIQTLEAQGRVTSVDWSPNANYLLAISTNQDVNQTYIEVWDFSTEDRLVFFPVTDPFVGASWSPDERSFSILTGSDFDYTLSVVDVPTGNTRFDMSFSTVPRVQWKPDGLQLAVMQTPIEGDRVDIVDSATGVAFPLVTVRDVITVTSMDWHPSEDWLVISTGNELIIYDVQNQTVVSSIDSESQIIGWSPDGTRLAVRYPDQTIGIWQLNLN